MQISLKCGIKENTHAQKNSVGSQNTRHNNGRQGKQESGFFSLSLSFLELFFTV
jgi:hypothetical protein